MTEIKYDTHGEPLTARSGQRSPCVYVVVEHNYSETTIKHVASRRELAQAWIDAKHDPALVTVERVPASEATWAWSHEQKRAEWHYVANHPLSRLLATSVVSADDARANAASYLEAVRDDHTIQTWSVDRD